MATKSKTLTQRLVEETAEAMIADAAPLPAPRWAGEFGERWVGDDWRSIQEENEPGFTRNPDRPSAPRIGPAPFIGPGLKALEDLSMYRIESLPGRAISSDDAPWQPVRLEPTVDTSDLGAMLRAVEDLEMDADGRDQFRIVPVEEPAFDYVDHWVEAEHKWVKVRTPVSARRVA